MNQRTMFIIHWPKVTKHKTLLLLSCFENNGIEQKCINSQAYTNYLQTQFVG